MKHNFIIKKYEVCVIPWQKTFFQFNYFKHSKKCVMDFNIVYFSQPIQLRFYASEKQKEL